MRRKLGITAALVVALAMAGYAQKKPDFSGTWTLDTEKSDPMPQRQGGGGGGGGGMGAVPMTIKQTADALTIERTFNGNTNSTSYTLDGTEKEIQMMGRGGQPTTAKAKAKWDGDKIVIETTREGQNGPVTTKAKYSLDGANLVVETETANGTRKSVYKKTT